MTQIVGGSGNDTLHGASGADTILGSGGHDSLIGATAALGANLLVDGSFETSGIADNTWAPYVSVGGWHSDSGVEVWGKDFILPASDGNAIMELDFDNQFSKVWQDVKTDAGREYTLSMDTAMRPGTDAGTNAINVFWNDQLVGRIEPGSTAWAASQFHVVGSGGTDRLEFREDAGATNDSYGGMIDNVKLQAEGASNFIVGGTGNDTLSAGNQNDMLVGNDAKSGAVDMTKMKASEDVTAKVTFDGSGAGYHNTVGMYTYDKDGVITGVQIVYKDISGQGVNNGPANPDVTLKAGEHFGFFVASNAYNQDGNAALLNDGTGAFKLVDAVTGGAANVAAGHEFKLVFVAADGTETDVKTQYGTSLFTTNTADNGDGYQHARTTVDPLTGKLSVAFEDLQNGGDQNFWDANFSIDVGSTNAVQMAHAGASSGHAVNNDLLLGGTGNDTLIGMSGDDTLNGGSGSNNLFGGSGDDRFVAGGGNDKITGGSGFDTLDLSNATGAVTINLSKHTLVGYGVDVVKSVEGVIATSFNDTIMGDKRANDINGGAGDDHLRGYLGADTLTGGAGADTFVWLKKDLAKGGDELTDFGNGKDVLDLHKLFNGIHGDHSGLVSLVDKTDGSEIHASFGGHDVTVAMLDGVHGATVADLLAAHQLLV